MKRIEFKVGQKVVALKECSDYRAQPRKKGCIYSVLGVMYCVGCGVQSINIVTHHNHPIEGRKWDGKLHCNCGCSQPSNDKFWTYSAHFAPLDNLHESISEAEKNEDYELAQLLTEVLTENVELSELGI